MKLKQVNKPIYRKRLNIVIAAFIGCFALLSILFGTVLIALFAEPILNPETQSNFKYNVAGVILGLVFMSMLMNSIKRHEFLQDIYYVWQLKQIHNHIYRKLVKIKNASEESDVNALIVLSFYYISLKQVYELDNNTLTISSVEKDINRITELLNEKDINQEADKFDKNLLAYF